MNFPNIIGIDDSVRYIHLFSGHGTVGDQDRTPDIPEIFPCFHSVRSIRNLLPLHLQRVTAKSLPRPKVEGYSSRVEALDSLVAKV